MTEAVRTDRDVFLRVRDHDHDRRSRTTLHQGPFPGPVRDLTEAGWTSAFVTLDSILERTSR